MAGLVSLSMENSRNDRPISIGKGYTDRSVLKRSANSPPNATQEYSHGVLPSAK